jgi:hypothetical protein
MRGLSCTTHTLLECLFRKARSIIPIDDAYMRR